MKMIIFDFRDSEKEFFEQNELPDFDITFIKEPLTEKTVLTEEQWNDTDVISVFINSTISEEIINKFKNLRIISTRSTGYNHIDTRSCVHNNIAVFNVEQYGKSSVAQYTICLILAVVRNLFPAYFDIMQQPIDHGQYEGRNLEHMTLGIIGAGAIGAAVAKLAYALGMRVIVYSYMKNPEISDFVEYVSFDELLEQSDVISPHVPYAQENYHMIGEQEFARMKDGVYIVNTARGELIDIMALYENLQSGKVKGAALDVLECEYLAINTDDAEDIKKSSQKCVTNALITQKMLDMKNVIITPHVAYNTHEAIMYLLEKTFNNIRDFIKGNHSNRLC